MRELIRKILREERNVDYTRLIQKLVDKAIISKYPEDICKIEVEGYTKIGKFSPRYWVSVVFNVSDNHLSDRNLAKNIMDDIWTTINSYFEISPSMRSNFHDHLSANYPAPAGVLGSAGMRPAPAL